MKTTGLFSIALVLALGCPSAAVRRLVESGELPGPTVYTAGWALEPGETQTRAHVLPVSGVAGARAETRRLLDAGVDA